MPPLQILKSTNQEPQGYTNRLTVKGVVFNEDKQVLLFSGSLLGGGVEEGESLEAALQRECLEEAGIKIEVLRELGTVIQFRDVWQKRYEIHGFIARFVTQLSLPTSVQENEQGRTSDWYTPTEAEQLLQEKIAELERIGNINPESDRYQAQLFNTQTTLIFLREALKVS